ncbi:hypothetical protein B5G27_12630 [Lachnoclostridium sp. An76]|nr:hypothetical protein B5G27_12630 [Lachnoclostridium sp. An76]
MKRGVSTEYQVSADALVLSVCECLPVNVCLGLPACDHLISYIRLRITEVYQVFGKEAEKYHAVCTECLGGNKQGDIVSLRQKKRERIFRKIVRR